MRGVLSPGERMDLHRIRFYKNGLAYFERMLEIDNEAIQLRFKKDEMNDVIKSLTIIDPTGSSVPIVSYESIKPAAKTLEELPISLDSGNALEGLVNQLRGVDIKVSSGNKTFEGRVVGVEHQYFLNSGSHYVDKKLLILSLSDGEFVPVDLVSLSSLEILSKSVNEDLNTILETSMRALKKDLRTVTVRLLKANNVKKKRSVLVSYTIEAPVWKTTYRLIMEKDKPIVIQGLVIVENTTEEDWSEVNISLISGKPVSFKYDLYSPYYTKRQTLGVREELANVPQSTEEAEADDEDEEVSVKDALVARMRDTSSSLKPKSAGYGSKPSAVMAQSSPVKYDALSTQSLNIKASTVGELVEFDLGKISLQKNQAALIPIATSKLEGGKASFYNSSNYSRNPMLAVRVKNSSGVVLEGGPITIIDSGAYAGEAMLKTLSKDEETYLLYAVDGDVTIDSESESKEENVFKKERVGEYLYEYFYRVSTRTYKINNKSDEEKTVFIDSPRESGYELLDPEKALESTPNYFRFKITVPAKKGDKFVVKTKKQEYYSKRLPWLGRLLGGV